MSIKTKIRQITEFSLIHIKLNHLVILALAIALYLVIEKKIECDRGGPFAACIAIRERIKDSLTYTYTYFNSPYLLIFLIILSCGLMVKLNNIQNQYQNNKKALHSLQLKTGDKKSGGGWSAHNNALKRVLVRVISTPFYELKANPYQALINNLIFYVVLRCFGSSGS